ncbi:hypothetical protein IC620_10880 [Hazenella sp. IB182357]|uniref:Uncharacterized protein n=1 Tax=Polycladospora coralii TaxID=2771432 RepID=A0A926NCH6_9BACL|nr:hypothetical protein [Polycladospora coralii]MBD1372860.1 hypothetical protein [Polycladospora coralii]
MFIFKLLFRFCGVVLSIEVLKPIIPNMKSTPLTTILAALFIMLLGASIELISGGALSPFARAIIGTFSSAFTFWLYAFFSATLDIPLFAIAFLAIWIGLFDLFAPTGARYAKP